MEYTLQRANKLEYTLQRANKLEYALQRANKLEYTLQRAENKSAVSALSVFLLSQRPSPASPNPGLLRPIILISS